MDVKVYKELINDYNKDPDRYNDKEVFESTIKKRCIKKNHFRKFTHFEKTLSQESYL